MKPRGMAGIIVFIAVFIPIVGIPIALAYSGRGYYKLEKKAHKYNSETVTTLNEDLQDELATENEKQEGSQGTGQKIKVNNWKIFQ